MAYAASFVSNDGSGTYTLTNLLVDIDFAGGLDIPSEKVPRVHGEVILDDVTLKPRRITGHWRRVYGSSASAQTDIDDLSRIMVSTTGGKLYLSADRYITCYFESNNLHPVEGTQFTVWEMDFTLFAADPFWYGAEVTQTEDFTAQPWNFTITNSGNVLVFPKFNVIANQGVSLGAFTLTNNTLAVA